MSIPEGNRGDKSRAVPSNLARIARDWVLLGLIFLTGTLCFGLGLMAGKEEGKKGDSLWIEQLPKEETAVAPMSVPKTPATTPQPAAVAATIPASTGKYVASKTGSKYYLPTCATAKRIKDENKVWFNTKEDAEKAGLTPGSNCKGL